MFIFTVSLLLGSVFITSATNVRLVQGQHAWEGRVEVYHNGWGTICDDDFSTPDAQVICRMLGYSTGHARAFSSAHFGQGSGSILLDDVGCRGSESDIALCSNAGWGKHNCGHSEDVGVSCVSGGAVDAIRLIGGRGNFEGTVDILSSRSWGSLCDRHFTNADATVICKSLGFNNGTAVRDARFGQLNYGTIFTSELGCNGTETSIEICSRFSRTWTQTASTSGCNHSMDAGVICDHTPARLVDGVLPSDGRLEVLRNGVWGTVCSDGFNQTEADVFCHMLGFNHSAVTINRHAQPGSGPVWLGDVDCHGNEADLSLCNHGGWDNNTCDHSKDVGLTCRATDVRLVGGSGPWEGTVEVNLNGQFGTICDPDFGNEEATVICRMLGYNSRDAIHTVYHSDNFHNHHTATLDKITCTGQEADINQCVPVFHSSCSSTKTVGLKCEGAKVRLAGSVHSGQGRVEILHGGRWGTICDDDWDDVDATVVCKMLSDYPFDAQVTGKAVRGSFFGYGDGPVWLSSVRCHGNESDIMGCSSDATGGVNCDHSRDAGAICNYHREKRLSGGNSDSEGTVLFQSAGSWHTYCDAGWNVSDAKVVCKELGYWFTSPTVYNHAHFGTIGASGSSYDIGPHCNGQEGHLEMCKLDAALTRTCSSTNSVGVDCNPTAIDTTEVRLVDGPGPWKGRLEVKVNGNWGSFCYDSWNDSNADIVCRSLHFPGSASSTYHPLAGYTAAHFRSLECDGSESNMGLCRMDPLITHCNRAVGIDCSEGIKVSISDGSSLSGFVYIDTPDHTGTQTVCGSGVDDVAARVICASQGYKNTAAWSSSAPHSAPMVYSSIGCDGWETHVSQCSRVNISESGDNCTDAAKVHCFNCTSHFQTSFGTTTSQYYPSSYPPNQDCLITIHAPKATPTKLQFNNLQLAGDGDYIEVRDSFDGHQLGYFTNSSNVPYLVSRYGIFYIRFKTNAAGAAQGFNISWSPLEISDTVHMACGPSGWDIAVNSTILRALYGNSGVSQIKLSDQHCTGRIDGDLVWFKQSYTECSTKSQTTGSSVVYTNELVYPEARTPFPIIVHGYRWKVEVECDVARTDTVVNNFHPNQTVIHHTPHVSGSTHYNVNVGFFTDGSYYKELKGNPLSLRTGDDVFVKVKLNSDDTHVKMRVHTCFTRPDPKADPSLVYTLIQNGCPVDPDTHIISQGTHETRFFFNAFEFPASHDNIYLYCNATYCQTSDVSAACTQTCQSGGNGGTPPVIGRSVGKWTFV